MQHETLLGRVALGGDGVERLMDLNQRELLILRWLVIVEQSIRRDWQQGPVDTVEEEPPEALINVQRVVLLRH